MVQNQCSIGSQRRPRPWACVLPDDDGYPEAVVHRTWRARPSSIRVHLSTQMPALDTLWYHDHALASRDSNVYAGLAGFYLIRDEAERVLNLLQASSRFLSCCKTRLFHRDGLPLLS